MPEHLFLLLISKPSLNYKMYGLLKFLHAVSAAHLDFCMNSEANRSLNHPVLISKVSSFYRENRCTYLHNQQNMGEGGSTCFTSLVVFFLPVGYSNDFRSGHRQI